MTTHEKLIKTSQTFEEIAYHTPLFTSSLAELIDDIGTPIERMTIGELLKLANTHKQVFERMRRIWGSHECLHENRDR